MQEKHDDTALFALVKENQGCHARDFMRGTDFCANRDLTELTQLRKNRLNKDLPALKQKLVDFIHQVEMQYQTSRPMG